MDITYNKQYYEEYGNEKQSYSRVEPAFLNAAEKIVQDFHPKTVLDAGCAWGFLVAALRDLGVEAYGIDISEYAISKVREDIRPYCVCGSLTEPLPSPLPDRFDLIVTVEVLEHLYAEDGEKAVKNLCALSDHILFSSDPDDYAEPTHFNVQKREYWADLFARQGFFDDISYGPDYLSKHAMLFRKDIGMIDLVRNYEHFIRRNVHNDYKDLFGKIYFNYGHGENEEDSLIIAKDPGFNFKRRIIIPKGCKSVRFDPVEGFVCLVHNLQVCSDSGILKVGRHNGIQLDNLFLFPTIDPQIYIENFAESTHWIDIEGGMLCFEDSSWLFSLCQSINNSLDQLETEKAKCYTAEAQLAAAKKVESQLTGKNQKLSDEIKEYEKLVASERAEAKRIAEAYEIVSNSTIWRMTKPVRKILDFQKAVLRKMKNRGSHTRKAKAESSEPEVNHIESPQQSASENHLARNPITEDPVDPIQTIMMEDGELRLNLVTDTLDASSLLGGVATALIIATEYANEMDCELRIITRKGGANPGNYKMIMELNGIEPAKRVSFYSDYERFSQPVDYKLEISPNDIFFATSWWSAMAITQTTIRKRFFYILQEVETFFYNYGGERLLCDQIMKNENIDFIINSGYLYRYFEKTEPNIIRNGCYFEPAFSRKLYCQPHFTEKTKYKLFFYARPNNPRNLYQIGVMLLNRAVSSGVLDMNEWDIYCVGQDAPVIKFSNGAESINLGQLSWAEYADFLSDIDLGLCLMYTPHPSYPPFDVACSGGVVISNKMLNKQSFDMCKNVILADLDEEKFMDSFREAIQLAKNSELRKRNFEESTIPRDWDETLKDTISYMKEKSRHV